MKSLFFASFLFLIAEFSFAKEEIKYTISSDSQINTVKGDLKANGNVLIKRTNDNFEASSDKLTYDNDSKTLKLFGNVLVKKSTFGVFANATALFAVFSLIPQPSIIHKTIGLFCLFSIN